MPAFWSTRARRRGINEFAEVDNFKEIQRVVDLEGCPRNMWQYAINNEPTNVLDQKKAHTLHPKTGLFTRLLGFAPEDWALHPTTGLSPNYWTFIRIICFVSNIGIAAKSPNHFLLPLRWCPHSKRTRPYVLLIPTGLEPTACYTFSRHQYRRGIFRHPSKSSF